MNTKYYVFRDDRERYWEPTGERWVSQSFDCSMTLEEATYQCMLLCNRGIPCYVCSY